MNLEKIKEQQTICQKQLSELFDIFGFHLSEDENNIEIDFFDFLELAYNKLLLQGTLYTETQPFVTFLNDIVSDEYFSSYSYNSLSVNDCEHTQVESPFKDFCIKLLMNAESELEQTIHGSKGAVNNVLDVTQGVSRGDALFYGFKKFVESKYSPSELDTDNICCDICHFYEKNAFYEELLKLSEYGKNHFLGTANYCYYSGVAHYFLDNNDEAKQYFTEFLIYSPRDVQTIGFLMIIELQELLKNIPGSQKGFEAIAKRVQELNSQFPLEVNYNILYAGAISNYNLGNFGEAATLFEKVLEMDPDDEANFASLAASYERSGQFQKALDLLLSRQKEYGNDEEFQKSVERIRNKINQK